MNQSYRYVLYLLIGMGLYFVLKDDNEDQEVLNKVHGVAPYIILGIIVLMVIARAIQKRRRE